MSNLRGYAPPGPVVERFLASKARVRAIMGPLGSGKTGGCLMTMIYRAAAQEPHPRDKVRRTKFAVIRETYRQLEKTTIKSWNYWVPKETGHWVGGSGGQPAVHTLRWGLIDGTTVEMIVEFIGLGDGSAEDVMPGWEGTGAYLNEADKLTQETLNYVLGRIGRYPAVDADVGFGGATNPGVWMDFNAPDTDHWLYDLLVDNLPKGWEFFVQPGAVVEVNRRWVTNPRAENLRNLKSDYYSEQIPGQPRWYIRRLLANLWGASRDGEPVYPEWNDELHVAPTVLEPTPGLPLVIGADAGLTSAAIILQQTPFGQWQALDELIADPTGWGAGRFGEELLRLLRERYAPWLARMGSGDAQARPIRAWGDPAGAARSSTDERSWMQVVSAATGIPFLPAPTNSPTLRQEAVRTPLTRLIDGQPGFLLSPRCKVLRKGFNSGYRLKRNSGGQLGESPDKNEYSHPHDALQYGLCGGGEHLEALGRQSARTRFAQPIQAQTDFSVFGR